jgi:starch synthase
VTRQKGLGHLLAAAARLDPAIQVVLCAGSPDTPELGAETAAAVAELAETRTGVIWLREVLPRPDLVQLLTHATVFVCPSVYEPLGIVNLEAMACGTPVVACAVGGIPEVVADGETGLLVAYSAEDVPGFRAGLAEAIGTLCADPARARAMGCAGRERAVHEFSWPAIAEQTLSLYRSLR